MVEEKIMNVNGLDYFISSDGKVYSAYTSLRMKYHQEIKQRYNQDGYKIITTGLTAKRMEAKVHRLVAQAFIPNPDNLPEINHKDYNRENNNVENLEWCTHEDNIKHSAGTGRMSHYGEDNPNYGNNTLKKKYASHPDLAIMKNRRPGIQNGRCRRVRLFDLQAKCEMDFDYIRQAAQYLMDMGYARAKKLDSISNRITININNKTIFYNRFKAIFVN